MAQSSPMIDDDVQEPVNGNTIALRPEVAQPTSAENGVVSAQEEPAKPSRSRRKAGLFGLGLLVALAGVIAWYPLSDHHAPSAGGGSLIGEVTQIAARVSGPIESVLIADNSTVSAGQPLFAIDATTFEFDIAQAEAQLDQVVNSIATSSAAIPAAEAKLEQARIGLATAEEQRDRTQQLFERGLSTDAQLTQANANYDTAVLNVSAAEAELERVTSSAGPLDGTNPNLRSAQAGVEKARFALESTTVSAPADGYVSNLSLTAGQFVAAGSPVMTFISDDRDTVIVDFRENQLVNVEPGDRALVAFEGAPGRRFEAKVESIAYGISNGRTSANGLAQSSTDSRWFPPARKVPVRITLDDPEAVPASVRVGSEASALVLPDDGIIPMIAQGLMSLGGLMSGFN